MGKRVSAVAVLLATSFLGSLMALVLVGRNPLVGGPPDQVRTEALRQGLEGSPVSVEAASSPALSSVVQSSEAVEEAVLSATDVRPVEASYRPGAEAVTGNVAGAEPTPAPEVEQPTEDDGVVAKTADESADPGDDAKNGKAKGHDKATGGDEGVDDEPSEDASDGSSGGGPKGGANGPKEPKGSKGGGHDGATGNAGEQGSGKGQKPEKHTGSGKGSTQPHGKAKGKS